MSALDQFEIHFRPQIELPAVDNMSAHVFNISVNTEDDHQNSIVALPLDNTEPSEDTSEDIIVTAPPDMISITSVPSTFKI